MRLRRPAPPAFLTSRVLSVGPIPPEWGGDLRGGVTRFHASLLDEWRRERWRHLIEPVGVLIPPPQRLKRHRAKRKAPLPIFMQPEDARRRRFAKLLYEQTAPDLTLLHNVAAFAPARFAGVHAGIAPQVPLLGIVHAWHQVTMKRDAELADHNRANAQQALDRMAAVVFGSRHCLDEGVELGFRYPERQEVIPYPLQQAYLDEMDVGAARDGVLFLGSLNERKNPMALLEAIAPVPGLRLTFAGEGNEEERLRERVADLGLSKRVRFVPHQDPKIHVEAMRELVRTAEVLCLPSLSESFGIVMIEALAAGTPVAGFGPTFVEIRERTGIDIGEPIFSGGVDEIAIALESVRSRQWDRPRLRRAALSEFSPRSVARGYSRLVRELVRHPP